jgi:hypothetical protein
MNPTTITEFKIDFNADNQFGFVGSVFRLPGNGLYTIGVDFVDISHCGMIEARRLYSLVKHTGLLQSFQIGGPPNPETFHHHRQEVFRDETLNSVLKMLLDTALLEAHLEFYKQLPDQPTTERYAALVDDYIREMLVGIIDAP